MKGFVRGESCYQEEIEKVFMTHEEFKEHLISKGTSYMKHHFCDVMNSQSRRKLYNSAGTKVQLENVVEIDLATSLILAVDFAAIFDHHSQDQLSNTI